MMFPVSPFAGHPTKAEVQIAETVDACRIWLGMEHVEAEEVYWCETCEDNHGHDAYDRSIVCGLPFDHVDTGTAHDARGEPIRWRAFPVDPATLVSGTTYQFRARSLLGA